MVLGCLEAGDRPAELVALCDVIDGLVQHRPGSADHLHALQSDPDFGHPAKVVLAESTPVPAREHGVVVDMEVHKRYSVVPVPGDGDQWFIPPAGCVRCHHESQHPVRS